MIPIEDFTDVTLSIEDTDEDDEEDLTYVTLVSDDTYWRQGGRSCATARPPVSASAPTSATLVKASS